MNKLFTKIATSFVGIAMAIGVGVAIGSNDAIKANASADAGYTAATMTAGTNGSTCTVNSNSGIKVGTSSKGGDMTVTVPSGATDLRIYSAAWKGVSGLSLNITKVSGAASATISESSIALTADSGIANSSPFTLSGSESTYRFDFTLTNITADTVFKFASSTTKRFVLWSAQTKSESSDISASINGSTSAEVGIQWTTGGITEDEGGATVTGATYSFEASDGAVISSSSASNGTFTCSSAGTVTVSATKTGYEISNLVVTVISTDPFITLEKDSTTGVVDGNEIISFTYGYLENTLSAVSSDSSIVTVDDLTYEDGEGLVQIGFAAIGSTTVKFNDGSTELASLDVTVREDLPKVTYDFTQISGLSTWGTSYSQHTVEYTEGDVWFAAASKQTSTITNMPVTKGSDVEFVANEGITINSATFVCEQWTTKTQTITLHYSTDGGETYTSTGITSDNFTITCDSLPANTNAIKISFNSQSNQVGISSLTITYTGGSATTYTVTYDANEGTGTLVDPDSPYTSGATVTVLDNTFSREDYNFSHWNTASDNTGTSYNEGDTFEISSDVTLYAVWSSGPTPVDTAARCYTLVTDASELAVGGKIIITSVPSNGSAVALSTTQNTNNRAESDPIVVNNNVAIVDSNDVQVITLSQTNSNWEFNVGDGYLYAASSSKNYLKTQSTNDENGQWTISITDGVATITAQGSNTHNLLQYNRTNSLFSCYATSQQNIQIYKLSFEETLLHNVTCDGQGSHSLPAGYSWNTDLKGVYDDLPLAEQTALKTASNAGTARYDYIVGKYGTSTYNDFIGRNPSPIGHSIIISAFLNKETTNTAIVVVVTVVATALAVGGYFLLHKKKED